MALLCGTRSQATAHRGPAGLTAREAISLGANPSLCPSTRLCWCWGRRDSSLQRTAFALAPLVGGTARQHACIGLTSLPPPSHRNRARPCVLQFRSTALVGHSERRVDWSQVPSPTRSGAFGKQHPSPPRHFPDIRVDRLSRLRCRLPLSGGAAAAAGADGGLGHCTARAVERR